MKTDPARLLTIAKTIKICIKVEDTVCITSTYERVELLGDSYDAVKRSSGVIAESVEIKKLITVQEFCMQFQIGRLWTSVSDNRHQEYHYRYAT